MFWCCLSLLFCFCDWGLVVWFGLCVFLRAFWLHQCCGYNDDNDDDDDDEDDVRFNLVCCVCFDKKLSLMITVVTAN